MNEVVAPALAFFAGAIIGAIFFGGLWWTVRKGVTASQPALWFLGSFVVRIGIAAAGFYFVSRGDFARLVACLFGFLAARLVVTRLTKSPAPKDAKPFKEESSHAP